jgi:hypothetical protein
LQVYKREIRTFVVTSPTINQDLRSLSILDLRQIRCIRFVVDSAFDDLPEDSKKLLEANKIICFNSLVKIVFIFVCKEKSGHWPYATRDSLGKWNEQSRYLVRASRKGVDTIEIGIEFMSSKFEGGNELHSTAFRRFDTRREGQVGRNDGTIFIIDLSNETTSLVPKKTNSLRIIG